MLIKYEIFDKNFEIQSRSKDLSDIKVHNLIKRKLGREKINLNEWISNFLDLKKCYCCNKYANYDLDFHIKKSNNIIIYTSHNIKYPKIQEVEKLYCGSCLKSFKYNANSKIFISKVCNINELEANEIILKRNKSPFYKTNFNTEEEYKKSQSRGYEFYKKKYGTKKGKNRYLDNLKKWYTASNNFNHLKDSGSLSFFESKYKDKNIALKKFQEKCNQIGYANTLEYYIKKHGEIEGEKKWIEWKNKCKISEGSFIQKYGEIEGKKKYKKWLIGITNNSSLTFSKEANNFFQQLQELIKYKIYYKNNEQFIYDNIGFNGQKIFFYDGYIKELNLLIEYDTPTYHPNPVYLTEEEIKSRNYKGNYEKDIFKENLARKKRYNFYRCSST